MALNVRHWFKPSPWAAAARRLYAAVVAQSREPDFYTVCGVPDTATGRFDLIALHGFLVMHRLKAEAVARPLAQALAETIVDDLDRNLREMGTGDLSVGKKVKGLMQGFFGRMGAYEQGLAGDDRVLISALRRNLYGTTAPTEHQLAAVARYVRREAGALAQQSVDRLRKGEELFGPPPNQSRELGEQ